jgi:hypothetical protein
MFVGAIERVSAFVRPIHSIARTRGSQTITPGAATLFFVNADGWALTCKHVAAHVFAPMQGQPIELRHTFVNCVEGELHIDGQLHPSLDVALLHFKRFRRLLCPSFPTFAKDGDRLKPGKSLCRIGYPFPEFTNFEYDPASDQTRWTQAGKRDTPSFPIDGMVTRHLGTPEQIVGFEMSTPGLKGQSGGPAFDADGRVWGMQSATNHLDLDFDVDVEVARAGGKQRVKESAFLHVGHCVHVNVLKQFMREHKVGFDEA